MDRLLCSVSTTSSFKKAGVPQHGCGIGSGLLRKLRGGGEYQRLIGGFVVARSFGSGARLGNDHRASVGEAHYRRNVEAVLVEAGKEECAVAAHWAAEGEAELLLLIVGLEVHEGMLGGERAVAHVIEIGSVKTVGPGFGDHIHHRAAGASQFGAVGIGGNAELLHHFVGKLIGRAVAAASLAEEGVVVVAAIDQVAGLEAANAAKSQIAVRARSQAARVLRDAGSKQREIGEAPAVQRQFVDGAFVDQRGDSAGLGFDKRRLA